MKSCQSGSIPPLLLSFYFVYLCVWVHVRVCHDSQMEFRGSCESQFFLSITLFIETELSFSDLGAS